MQDLPHVGVGPVTLRESRRPFPDPGAGVVTPTASSSFVQIPPNAPFDIPTTTSPDRACFAIPATISSTLAEATAGTPRRVMSAARRSTSSRSASGTRSVGAGRSSQAAAAEPKLRAYSSWWRFRRLVLDRGSKATSSRAPGYEPWMAASVRSTAVGWWAKSSMTVTPPATPRTSWRRFTPRKASQPRRDLRER